MPTNLTVSNLAAGARATVQRLLPEVDFSLGSLFILLLLFLGVFSLARAVQQVVRERRPGTPAILSGLFFAFAVLIALVEGRTGMLFSGASLLVLVLAVACALLTRIFPRLLGLLFILVAAAVVICGALILRDVAAHTERIQLATVHVGMAEAGRMALIVEHPDGQRLPEIRLRGTRFRLGVFKLVFSDAAIFYKIKTRYLWLGVTAEDDAGRQSDAVWFGDLFPRQAWLDQVALAELGLPFLSWAAPAVGSHPAQRGSSVAVWLETNAKQTFLPVPRFPSVVTR